MHGPLDKSGKNENSIYQRWGIGPFALPVLLVLTLLLLTFAQPSASNWISEAVQAEFTGYGSVPDQAPTQVARPAMQIRTVRAN